MPSSDKRKAARAQAAQDAAAGSPANKKSEDHLRMEAAYGRYLQAMKRERLHMYDFIAAPCGGMGIPSTFTLEQVAEPRWNRLIDHIRECPTPDGDCGKTILDFIKH